MPGINLDTLNPQQREAVLATEGPLLVLAGAGSGKTRVLTHRIAHIIQDLGVSPYRILAITFTNKAAAEMRDRLEALLGHSVRGMWVCTFHAMCVRMLRADGDLIGYRPNFSIYDEDDSKRLVRTIMDDLEIDQKHFPPNMIRSLISDAKNRLVDVDEFEAHAQAPHLRKAAQVYRELEKRLARANALDFDDLLVKCFELLSTHPEVLERYQERFRYISVDEYQDTNHVQYMICALLAKSHRNLMVVGDDDQSIYSWRGADITNILNFEKDYPDAKTVSLEQNYRSTGHILEAANAVVAHNATRKSKHLFTDRGDGEKIRVYQAADERDEGRWIASEIEKLHDAGTSYNDIAVFYRTNAQSRILEDMLMRAGVPYKIVGGTRFFDRAEIRDVMAYLKLVVNPADDVAALRVVNTPRRGIGQTSIDKIRGYAAREGLSFFEACEACIVEEKLLTPKVRAALTDFCQIVETSRHIEGELAKVVESIVEKAGLVTALQSEYSVEAEARIENIKEFYGVAAEFDASHEVASADDSGGSEGLLGEHSADAPFAARTFAEQSSELPAVAAEKLPAFLEWLALRSDLDSLNGSTTAATLMTVHSAKGLEYPVVFVSGLEEGIFPHRGTSDGPADAEEERRLAYVAITRAEQRLYLTHAGVRHVFGSVQANPRSRFINEIPEEHLKYEGIGSAGFSGTGWDKRGDRHGTFGSGRGSDMYGGRVFGSQTRSSGGIKAPEPIKADAAKAAESFAVGDQVSHKTFGPGTVIGVDGDAIEVRFSRTGKTKKLLKGFAPIVKIRG